MSYYLMPIRVCSTILTIVCKILQIKRFDSFLEKTTTNQLVVVTIEELGFDTIETYALGLFDQNGIGQKGQDHGLLILFSEIDKEVRIEVGYGLGPYITDAVASRIVRNTMIPRFKKGVYFDGIQDATNQLIDFTNNADALAEFKKEMESDEKNKEIMGIVLLGLFLMIFVGVGSFFFFKSYKNVIEVFKGIFLGKLGVLPGVFMLFMGSLSTLFGLVFVVVPMLIFYGMYFSNNFFFDGRNN